MKCLGNGSGRDDLRGRLELGLVRHACGRWRYRMGRNGDHGSISIRNRQRGRRTTVDPVHVDTVGGIGGCMRWGRWDIRLGRMGYERSGAGGGLIIENYAGVPFCGCVTEL